MGAAPSSQSPWAGRRGWGMRGPGGRHSLAFGFESSLGGSLGDLRWPLASPATGSWETRSPGAGRLRVCLGRADPGERGLWNGPSWVGTGSAASLTAGRLRAPFPLAKGEQCCPSPLIPWGYRNKSPRTGGLEPQRGVLSRFWKPEVPHQGVPGPAPPAVSGGGSFLPPPGLGAPGVLGLWPRCPISASVVTGISALISDHPLLSLVGTPAIGFGADPSPG